MADEHDRIAKGASAMAKIRHVAIRTEDVEATAAFFQEAFGLELVQRREQGPIDLSDGDVNLTLLPLNLGAENYAKGEIRPGYAPIGFTVEDEGRRTSAWRRREPPPSPRTCRAARRTTRRSIAARRGCTSTWGTGWARVRSNSPRPPPPSSAEPGDASAAGQ